MKINNITFILLIFVCSIFIIVLQGCATIHSIQASDLNSTGKNDIIVFINNGKVIQFAESGYRIDSSSVERVIIGEGLVIKDSSKVSSYRYSGSIAFSKIDSIQVSEFSSVSSGVGLGIVVVGSATVILLILSWILGPIHIG